MLEISATVAFNSRNFQVTWCMMNNPGYKNESSRIIWRFFRASSWKWRSFEHKLIYYWLNNYRSNSKRDRAWRLRAQRRITCRHTSYVFSLAWTVSSRACGQEKQQAARKGSSSATFGGHRNQPSTIVISSDEEPDLPNGLQYKYTWYGKGLYS